MARCDAPPGEASKTSSFLENKQAEDVCMKMRWHWKKDQMGRCGAEDPCLRCRRAYSNCKGQGMKYPCAHFRWPQQ